jgi:hypothetical protein
MLTCHCGLGDFVIDLIWSQRLCATWRVVQQHEPGEVTHMPAAVQQVLPLVHFCVACNVWHAPPDLQHVCN